MKKNYLKNETSAVIIQKNQLNKTDDKLTEIDSILTKMQNKQDDDDLLLDDMLDNMHDLLNSNKAHVTDDDLVNENINNIENELGKSLKDEEYDAHSYASEINSIQLGLGDTWEDYIESVNTYAIKYDINLQEDPFKHLMPESQQIVLQKRIKQEFTLRNATCDKYDYMIAGTCGVIGGLIDILFVGMLGDSKLGNIADIHINKATEKFAEFLGWDKDKSVNRGSNTTASAIGFLEKKFKINYDQSTTQATNGAVKNLSLKNHHVKSLGHSPDIIGLFFSILNQLTSTSTFISNGQIITIDTESFELQGQNFISKIFCGFANWIGHIFSDISGSSGSAGQGRRGTGVPIPFFNLFQMVSIGEFGQYKQTFAQMTTQVFENGYDFRHGMAMAIPVIVTELLVRFMYTMKAHFFHKKDWENSIPNGNIPEVRRMLLVGHGTLCLIDGADAAIRSGGEMITFLSRTNLLAWVRFGHLGLKELNAWYNSGHIDAGTVDTYLAIEYKKMLTSQST